MLSIFRGIAQAISVIVALVLIVERPKEGPEKRKEVIQLFKEEAHNHLRLPLWAQEIFIRDSFIGWLVDVIVWGANKFGFFTSSVDGQGAITASSEV